MTEQFGANEYINALYDYRRHAKVCTPTFYITGRKDKNGSLLEVCTVCGAVLNVYPSYRRFVRKTRPTDL